MTEEDSLSTVTPSERSLWLPLIAAGSAFALALGLLAVAVASQIGPRREAGDATGHVPAPSVVQAEWVYRASPAGIVSRLRRRDRHRIAAHSKKIERTLTAFYDAMFLDPESLPGVVKKTFTRKAARALRRSRVGLPKGATEVEATRRKAKVGIAAHGASQAVAEVAIKVTARAQDRDVRLVHRALLWLQRRGARWNVIAFEVLEDKK